jgi:hypothetical protein
MQDQQLPNEPRVMIDAQVEIRQDYSIPVLAQPSTQRLIVLNSTALNQMEVGQTVTLHLPDQQPVAIIIEAIDRSSLITRYSEPA